MEEAVCTAERKASIQASTCVSPYWMFFSEVHFWLPGDVSTSSDKDAILCQAGPSYFEPLCRCLPRQPSGGSLFWHFPKPSELWTDQCHPLTCPTDCWKCPLHSPCPCQAWSRRGTWQVQELYDLSLLVSPVKEWHDPSIFSKKKEQALSFSLRYLVVLQPIQLEDFGSIVITSSRSWTVFFVFVFFSKYSVVQVRFMMPFHLLVFLHHALLLLITQVVIVTQERSSLGVSRISRVVGLVLETTHKGTHLFPISSCLGLTGVAAALLAATFLALSFWIEGWTFSGAVALFVCKAETWNQSRLHWINNSSHFKDVEQMIAHIDFGVSNFLPYESSKHQLHLENEYDLNHQSL